MRLFLFILILGVAFGTSAQSGKLKKANNYFEKLSYAYAADLYQDLLGSEVDSPELKGKLAYCYLKMNIPNKAVEYYAQMIESSDVVTEDFYNYAYALKQTGNYSESDKWMDKFSEAEINDSRAKLYLANKDYRKTIQQTTPFFEIKQLDINTAVSDFGGYYSPDESEVYFLSARKKRIFIRHEHAWNASRFLDIYKGNRSEENQLSEVKKVKKVNTRFHEGPLAFSPDGKVVYYTRNNIASGKKRKDDAKIQNLKLYIADIDEKGKWKNEREFPYNSKEYSIGHPALSKDGKTMYLTSDKPGGYGGSDVYKVEVLENGAFGEMINLGNKINTEGQEMFPFIDSENRLFFSSDGHPGLGGLDVYIALFDQENEVNKIHNLGLPINSRYDDFGFTLSKELHYGYLSSNRSGGAGDDDVYSLTSLRSITFGVTIRGVAKDKKEEIVPFAMIYLNDSDGVIIDSVQAGEDGAYSFVAEFDKNYGILGTKSDYFDGSNGVSTHTVETEVNADVVLEKDPGLSLFVLVKDSKTDFPLENVRINLVDNFTGQVINVLTSKDGNYRRPLEGKKLNDRGSYNLIFQKDGYLSKTITFNTEFDREGQYDILESLDPEVEDLRELVEINPINFDLNKYNIRPDAAIELDKIVEIMNQYPNMVIELGAHTDCRGSKTYNMRLSERRAVSSAKYIKDRITNPERISGKGYGESRILNHCECEGSVVTDCSEEEHAVNRRTEFKVISTGDDRLEIKNTSTDSF